MIKHEVPKIVRGSQGPRTLPCVARLGRGQGATLCTSCAFRVGRVCACWCACRVAMVHEDHGTRGHWNHYKLAEAGLYMKIP